MVMFRGLADDLALMDWLQKYIFPAEAKTVSPEFVRIGTRLARLEMIESGTTTFADMYYFEEEIAKATREAGLRGVLGQTIIQFPVADAKTPADALTQRRSVHQGVQRRQPDRAGGRAARDVYARSRDARGLPRSLARRYDVPVLIHLAETEDEVKTARTDHQMTPAGYLESIGFWGPQDRRRARRLGDRRGHPDPEAPQRRRFAQSREQHEAGQRHCAGREVPGGRRRARSGHRRRRQQQRSRHVRSDAPGGVPRQARDARSDRGSGADGARHGDDRRGAERWPWIS